MTPKVPETVRQAVVTVCRDTFHWRDDVISMFLNAGMPRAICDRYRDPVFSNAKIAQGSWMRSPR